MFKQAMITLRGMAEHRLSNELDNNNDNKKIKLMAAWPVYTIYVMILWYKFW